MKATSATFNFTGKKKINLDKIQVTGHSDGYITIDKLELESLELPDDAQVIVEIMTSILGIMRFHLGEVKAIELNKELPLDVDLFGLAQIRVKVVSIKSGEVGKILAEAKGVQPEIGGRPPSLLPIVRSPLGPLVWRLYFDSETGPELRINDLFADSNQITHNVIFRSVVIPEVVYQIALWTLGELELSSEEERPAMRWANFFRSWGFNPLSLDETNSAEDWARDVSTYAASKFRSFLNCKEFIEEEE